MQEIEGLKIVDGRIVFSDREYAAKILNEVADMSQEEFAKWVASVGGGEFATYAVVDSTVDLPQLYLRILNKEGAFQVGDEIAIYHKGREYIASEKEFTMVRESQEELDKLPSMAVDMSEFKQEGEVPTEHPTEQPGQAQVLERGHYDTQRQFYYGGRERKLVHEINSFADRYFLIVEARNKFEYYHRRTFGRNTWDIEGTNCHKEIGPIYISWTGSASPFGGGPGGQWFGRNQTTWGNNTLVNSVALPADCIYGARVQGSMYSEFWGNELNNRTLNWNVGALCK